MTDKNFLDTKEIRLANYRMDIRYDGQKYYGWQRHKDNPTIQGALENAITQCFGLRVNVEGSGRTDRGVHAVQQVATVRLPDHLDPDAVKMLNHVLGHTIEILNLQKVSEHFHARESAMGKRYCYHIWNHPELPLEQNGRVWHIPEKLDAGAMRKACPLFVGKMDFASFAKVPNFKRSTTFRTVHALDLVQDGPFLCFAIIADGFLYKMVRNIIRLLVKTGEGRVMISDIPEIIKAKDRNASPGTAPASGLYLYDVFYDQQALDAAMAEKGRIK
ncbi:MAG: tRNA pseudouridine(38-40) synthase TruA [Proteobacteria bacterium]|nr:tRNA pseudouridine(38-40) synthase TruA [Pseudomonadota bacterium]MBU1386543.1 tRNA pseudouridine(38-40) synthase TruA [Pseudomonadota bacterium]MBU1544654.1 tRNA pseudouridine(38-40) synthase TruA [Pseudomonadota bacterium]MBU2430579.1 tRNA pseudouridine(38-40) synthase TruA [Pseudomonadota bacterium]MBU2481367.1 tRNA pseudouridine(38-40) synthase TruA [Pseudomonadota bacterium]